MGKSKYDAEVRAWMEEIQENCMQDAELTLKRCNDIISYGYRNEDDALVAFGYYYSGVVYYVLNDGERFFATMSTALSYLRKADEWELMARCYNFLGISALNRGNAVIAADYYENAITCCKQVEAEVLAMTISINKGNLSLVCGRYDEAIEVLAEVQSFLKKNPNIPDYRNYCLCLYGTLAKTYLYQGKLEAAREYFDRIHEEYEGMEDDYTMLSVLCAEAVYYHRAGMDEACDANIARIHNATTSNLPILDIFEDYYEYAKVLLERDKSIEFWHMIDSIEPVIKSLDITNLLQKLLGLKIRFYRGHAQSAEYLQACGLFYELSERAEAESREMMNSVMNIRKNLEVISRQKQEMEAVNKALLVQSQTDALTGLHNRFSLNDYSESIFKHAYEHQKSLIVEILDIDNFKGYNDTYGHQKGDDVILRVAQVLRRMEVKYGAFAARYGGDEFILIYEGASREDVYEYAEEIRRNVMNLAISYKESPVDTVVTVTQGLCFGVPTEDNRMWDFLHAADDYLYQTKQKQRNNFCIGDVKGEILIKS